MWFVVGDSYIFFEIRTVHKELNIFCSIVMTNDNLELATYGL